MVKLSDNEITALETIRRAGDSMLITKIPDRNERDVFGVEPGMKVYKNLEKKGLVFFTEEDLLVVDGEDFEFTPSVYLTDDGLKALK